MTRQVAVILVAVLVTLTSGCELSQDDEMAPRPTRTVTKSPAPAVPETVPVGQGEVSPNSVVWAQESMLHVGIRQVDLSPLSIDSFVAVEGGVFFVARGELWFTDLSRARGIGLANVTRVATTRSAGALLVEVDAGSGPVKTYVYDLGTGASVPADQADQAEPATDEDLRGREKMVVLRPGGDDGADDRVVPVEARMGPGRFGFGLVGGDGEPLVAFSAVTRRRLTLSGVQGTGFKLVRWQDRVAFFGLAVDDDDKPLSVVSCSMSSRRCTTVGKVDRDRSLAFEGAA